MDLNKATLMKATGLLMLLAACTLSSCNSSSKQSEDKLSELEDRIKEASNNQNFKSHQILCDEFYTEMKKSHDVHRELWLAYNYFYLCCYNGGSEDDVKMKMELYTEKYVGVGSLWMSVKDIDSIWFSNIERCEELLLRSHNDNPSLTNMLIDEHYDVKTFQAFANFVVK